jgi:hypothetical protein
MRSVASGSTWRPLGWGRADFIPVPEDRRFSLFSLPVAADSLVSEPDKELPPDFHYFIVDG